MNILGPTSDLVVIGGGAFGMWTALSAAERGARVTLIDQNAIGHPRGSSGGASRNIRAAYGTDVFYTRLAIVAWSAWQLRETEFGCRLLYPTGALRAEASPLMAQQHTFDACSQPCELLSGVEVRHRWPLLRYDDAESVFYEPLAGVLLASDALRAAARRYGQLGGQIIAGRVSSGTDNCKIGIMLEGQPIVADQIVVAAGPWLPGLFPDLIAPLMRTPRRELFFYATPPDDPRFSWQQMPNLSDDDGWTSADIGGGIKVAPLLRHIPLDPDSDPGPPGENFAQAARAYLARRVPSLADAALISTYVGQLENTASEHFIIDRHPDDPRIILAGGGSGHAFKFGPVLGPVIADFALQDTFPEDWRRRFALTSQRSVRPGEAG